MPKAAHAHRAGRRARWLWLAGLAALVLAAGCGSTEPPETEEPTASISLVSPLSPLGLNYGEPATLIFRYRLRDQPQPGATLRVSTDGGAGGSTLSAASIVTNDRGEASVLLTAGAAEVAFHVVVSAPAAADFLVDVAVSRYAFGSLGVSVDGTAVPGLEAPARPTAVRAALLMGMTCAEVPPMARLGTVLRSQRAGEPRAVLLFGTLLVHAYTVIGRAEDDAGHLLAYGCVEVPESLLRAGLQPVVEIPLSRVTPSPLGTFKLQSALALTLPQGKGAPVWPQLACPSGVGQALLDALIAALPSADRDIGVRLGVLRGAVDKTGCRMAPAGMDGPDQRLHALLTVPAAGQTLAAIADDVAAIQLGGVLSSRLVVRGVLTAPLPAAVADHTLTELGWQLGASRVSYPLEALAAAQRTDLVAPLFDAQMALPEHALTLRLPSFWRRAYTDLVAGPRGLTQTPTQLFQASVTAAKDGALTGCAAVENVLCAGLAAPCKGRLVAPCQAGGLALADALNTALSDGKPELDLRFGVTLALDDPEGTLSAQSLSQGVLTGTLSLPAGEAMLGGAVTGTRLP